jgi:hypothetical protein
MPNTSKGRWLEWKRPFRRLVDGDIVRKFSSFVKRISPFFSSGALGNW